MGKTKKKTESQILLDVAVKGLQEIKAENIVTIDLREIENAVCDFFIICTGTSNTHVNAIAGSVDREVKTTLQDRAWHTEGVGNAEWVLLDYVNVVVHIFQAEARSFYNIEGLWSDGKFTEIKDA